MQSVLDRKRRRQGNVHDGTSYVRHHLRAVDTHVELIKWWAVDNITLTSSKSNSDKEVRYFYLWQKWKICQRDNNNNHKRQTSCIDVWGHAKFRLLHYWRVGTWNCFGTKFDPSIRPFSIPRMSWKRRVLLLYLNVLEGSVSIVHWQSRECVQNNFDNVSYFVSSIITSFAYLKTYESELLINRRVHLQRNISSRCHSHRRSVKREMKSTVWNPRPLERRGSVSRHECRLNWMRLIR